MNLDEAKAVLAKCYRKVSFWRRNLYIGLFAIVLFAVLAFSIMLSTDNYLLPALLGGCMLSTFFLFCFSLYKTRFWEDKAERQFLDVALLDQKL